MSGSGTICVSLERTTHPATGLSKIWSNPTHTLEAKISLADGPLSSTDTKMILLTTVSMPFPSGGPVIASPEYSETYTQCQSRVEPIVDRIVTIYFGITRANDQNSYSEEAIVQVGKSFRQTLTNSSV